MRAVHAREKVSWDGRTGRLDGHEGGNASVEGSRGALRGALQAGTGLQKPSGGLPPPSMPKQPILGILRTLEPLPRSTHMA